MFILPSSRFSRGFTIIELMVTVAVLGVLAAIAAPSFQPLIERWQIRQVSEELQSTLYFARSEAIKRGGGIIIQRSTSATNCTVSDADLWNCGWVVYQDINGNGSLDENEELQVITPQSGIKIKFASTNLKTGSDDNALTSPVVGDRWGQLTSDSASNFAFRLTSLNSKNAEASASSLCISGGGRIKRLDSSAGKCI
ncbi:MAG: GspH/FimT family pseudopilin [Comamonas sp.]|uniref:GspH/FimT family pseudopilin n=1 Tax=Comamonas sp. TaxID=34028 RepID=UPI002FC843B1